MSNRHTDDYFPKEEAIEFLSQVYFGKHHIPDRGKLERWGYGWKYKDSSTYATFDFDKLTRLVLLAHKYAIRVQIFPCNMQYLNISIHKREREGQITERHPTIHQAIQAHNCIEDRNAC